MSQSIELASPYHWSAWAEDLRGHREVYRQSSVRWDQDSVLTLISWATNGRLEFTTIDDLAALGTGQTTLETRVRATRNAAGPHLARAAAAGGWRKAARAVGLDVDLAVRIERAARLAPSRERTSDHAHRATVGLHDNPLIHVWEIRQAWSMLAAAFDVVDDTLTTVMWELSEAGVPAAELSAAAEMTEAQIQARLRRREMEPGGDPLRPTPIPCQVY